MLTVALAVCCGTVCAQKSDKQKRLTREELAEKQARHIAGTTASARKRYGLSDRAGARERVGVRRQRPRQSLSRR